MRRGGQDLALLQVPAFSCRPPGSLLLKRSLGGADAGGVTCESHVNVYIGIFMFVYIFGVCEMCQ